MPEGSDRAVPEGGDRAVPEGADGRGNGSVPRAKLEPMAMSPDPVLARPRLVAALLDVPRAVSLVCAQAGAGKSLLLREVAADRRAAGATVAWLQLDPRDDDPVVLWRSLLAALQRVLGDIDGVLGGFAPPDEGPDPGFLGGVIRVLEDLDRPVWLIIEDVHELADRVVLDSLDWFLLHQPRNLRIVLSSRGETGLSLSRLRAAGQLAEIDAAALAFRPEEIRGLLAARSVTVSDAQCHQLHQRTGGWAVAVQIVALAVANGDDLAEVVRRLGADNRQLASYLGEQVLRRFAPEVRSFLLATSTVRQLDLELAEALSGRRDAGLVLEQLVQASLLTVRARVEGSGYRYHELLRAYLQTELRRTDRDRFEQLHARAARWYQQAGAPLDALDHARRARDAGLTLSLLEGSGLSLLLDGVPPEQVLGEQLPTELNDQPLVRLLRAEVALRTGRIIGAQAELSALAADHRQAEGSRPAGSEAGSPSAADAARPDGLAVLEASVRLHRARFGGDLDAALDAVHAVGGGETGEPSLDLYTLQHRGAAELYRGRYDAARADLERAIDLATARGADHTAVATLGMLSWAASGVSDLAGMRRFAQRGLELAVPRGWAVSPIAASAHLGRATGAYLDADRELTREHAELMLACLGERTDPNIRFAVGYAYAVQDALFGAATPRSSLERIRAGWTQVTADALDPVIYAIGIPEEIRLALAIGAVDWAEDAAARVAQRLPGSGEQALARALILRSGGLVRQAEHHLRSVVTGRTSCASVVTLVLAWLQTAELANQAERRAGTLEALASALVEAAPQGVLLPFVRLDRPVLELLRTHAAGFGPGEPTQGFIARVLRHELLADRAVVNRYLTATEHQVLQGLATMQTLVELADSRGVSVNTVKAHVRAIYRKLEVSTRRDAVAVAQREGLL